MKNLRKQGFDLKKKKNAEKKKKKQKKVKTLC
eukprot:CAMPEP_0114349616 /NCGR_PEP_ID=MMETSP0101-20121206/15677_1 /TAXON_ID=38822 ORGANISM="Pteridomonas danica, Strain PT" /NCGR_SAMPLE_ID=MMETSP0101 /ASSEMBLY_ACC=CAM_ASM_000211 /LENGTH=31 /DNA_ID= /DNA_START= /DNA_END= /DNA_ORIENTATION=